MTMQDWPPVDELTWTAPDLALAQADAPLGLRQQVQKAMAPDGSLARAWPGYRQRPEQWKMASAVAQAIQEHACLVVEAGTGVGKTLAYLVPILLSGKRILLSTASKTLQDQLYGRDLPALVAALGLPVRCALLKGRSSYVCLHRLQLAHQQVELESGRSAATLAQLQRWSMLTRTGDLAELPALQDNAPILPWVTSTRDNCLGSQCPRLRDCHLLAARRQALAADVLVVNHHLFFADTSARESSMAELLPTADVLVFDEAHQLNEIGIQCLGLQLGTAQLHALATQLLESGLQCAQGFADWRMLSTQLHEAVQAVYSAAAGGNAETGMIAWPDVVPQGLAAGPWHDAWAGLLSANQAVLQALVVLQGAAAQLLHLQEQFALLQQQLQQLSQPCAPAQVRWLDMSGAQLRVVQSPLTIATAMQGWLAGSAAGAAGQAAKSWIFTSATLGLDAGLSWFVERCGLDSVPVLRLASPFNYSQQAAWFVPPGMPPPADPAHSQALARWLAPRAQRLGGRTLVLTTSLRALRAIGAELSRCFPDPAVLQVLVQGQAPKTRLLELFRQGASRAQGGCVLVASMSFWEGVDLPGDALQLVVIDKLPFPPPQDPLVQASSKSLVLKGRSAFSAYSVPEAALALKQGAGRLIRSETDRGLLVVGDQRLVSMGYGKRLQAALPPMRRLNSQEEFDQALQDLVNLTRASTTGPMRP